MKMTDEELAQELKRSKRGGAGGKVLEILGGLVIAAGLLLGGSLPLILVGAILAGLGEWLRKRKRDDAGQQAFNTIGPEVLSKFFEKISLSPVGEMVDAEKSDIPLEVHSSISYNGRIRGMYHGMAAEMCSVVMTDTSSFYRDETEMWETNEQTVYTGQWMVCETGQTYPTGLTIWPRGKLDKVLRTSTIKTGDEDFDKRFNLSCDNASWALEFLNQGRMERFHGLMETAFSDFSVSLHGDGKLYIAAHSGRGFFDIGKGRETPEALRQRYSRELKWFTDAIDTFQPV